MYRAYFLTPCVLILSLLWGIASVRADLIINLAGMETKAGFASPLNSSQTFTLAANASVSSISWNAMSYESFAPSYQSEVIFAFSNSDRSQSWQFNVSAQDAPGVYTGSGGVGNMVLSSGGPFNVKADGILLFEVYESFTDISVSPNARFAAGTMRVIHTPGIAVPEPSGVGLCSLLVGVLAWRRQRATTLVA